MNKTIEFIQQIRKASLLRDGAGLTDAQLLGCFVERRDEAAFAALVKQHGPMVWGVCRRLLNHHDAEDAFQATFLALARKAASIVPRERVANWLYGAAYKTALQARRTAARRRAREKQVIEMPEPTVRENELWRELQPLLDAELSRLPDAYREVIVLSDLEGKPRKEVSRQLGLAEGTVGSRLARARAMLAKRLARQGLAVSAGTLAVVLPQQAALATVPAGVLSSAIGAASLIAAGHGAAGVISVKIVALTTGVVRTMFANKITAVITVLAALGFLSAGGGLLTYQKSKAEESKPPSTVQSSGQEKQGGKQKVGSIAKAKPSRADRLKALRDAYTKDRDKFSKDIRAGKIKENADGKYPGWTELLERYSKSARKLIDEDATDAVACEALMFCICDLRGVDYETDPALYRLVLEHHAASEKIQRILGFAPMDFLREVTAKSPHANVRLWANYHLAEKLYEAGKNKEAETLLEAISRDNQAKEIGGYVMGKLADTADRLLFEIRRLNVGKEIPEIDGTDLDGKAMKLSESRGKVTLLVFWATWCMPCMNMVPHERALAERYAGKPFIIVGVNGDTLPLEEVVAGKKTKGVSYSMSGKVGFRDGKVYDPDGQVICDAAKLGAEIQKIENGEKANPKVKAAIEKGLIRVIDDTARVKAAVKKHKISWRSFRSGQAGFALNWNVRAWPTIFLIDQRGIIRGKWKGDPGEKTLDTAIQDSVKRAENEKSKK